MISSSLRCTYQQNPENFEDFYALQGQYASALARLPAVIRDWLSTRPQPVRSVDDGDGPSASQGWRTARLSNRRRRELTQLLDAPGNSDRLPAWLRASLPVLSLLEIGDHIPAADPEAGREIAEIRGRLVEMRENVFLANYGLARSAASRGFPEGFDDRMSAACLGLLNAVDRYVPGDRAARFSYFATYWIRYHMSRQAQKFHGVIAFPIYQQRMGRKIAQFTLERREKGLNEATEAEVCAALEVGPDAYYRHRQRPTVVSLQAPAVEGEADFGFEHLLCDPAPPPGEQYETEDVTGRINGWLRRSLPPATRVMLAFAHEVGPLAEAGAEYLDHLREIAGERLRVMAD